MKTFSGFNNINEENTFTNESVGSLKGVITFKNGLSVEIIKEKYPWLMQAKFKNAVIGKNENGIVWYRGTWIDGTWENGTWLDGTWENGTWLDGVWEDGVWEDGVWEDGIWEVGEILNQETDEFEESDEPPTI